MSLSAPSSAEQGAKRWATRRLAFRVIKYAFVALLLALLGRHIWSLKHQWDEHRRWVQVDARFCLWIAASAMAYVAGQGAFAAYWHRLLKHVNVEVSFGQALRAYALGTVGKYIPGKAGVPIIRTTAIAPSKDCYLAVGVSVLRETVTAMAAGAVVAAICLLLSAPGQWLAWAGAAGLALLLLMMLHPAVFDRISRLASIPFPRSLGTLEAIHWPRSANPAIGFPLLGWLWSGLSFWCVLNAMGVGPDGWARMAQACGTAALATSAGFVVIVAPSGIAVRELVIIHVLGPVFGDAKMVVAALLLRIVWTLTEAALAGICYLSKRAATVRERKRAANSGSGGPIPGIHAGRMARDTGHLLVLTRDPFPGSDDFMTPTQTCDLSVIIPVLNEEENLDPLYQELRDVLVSTGLDYEIIFVDDGSTDRSPELLRDMVRQNPRVTVLEFRRNFGQTAAMAAGIDHARGTVLVPMDADLQNDPHDIPRLLATLDGPPTYDIVSGWRKQRMDKFVTRRIPSQLANWMIRRFTRVPIHDFGCTLKAYRREVLEKVALSSDLHRFLPALAAWHGARITEIVVHHRPRIHGQTKYGLWRTFRVLLDLITVKFLGSYFTKPLYFFGKIGLVTMVLSLAILAVAIGQRFGLPFLGQPEGLHLNRNVLVTLSALLAFCTLQCVLFGIVSELLVRIYQSQHARPIYHLRRIIQHDEAGEAQVTPLRNVPAVAAKPVHPPVIEHVAE